jgi:putative transposase
MREVLNILFYLNRSGCQWDRLPHDLLPKSTVYDYVVQWRDDGTWAKRVKVLRERTRVAAGRALTPSVVCIDSQSVKTTELGGPERGYDGGKKINGRKRHLLVDTLSVLLVILMTKASLDDGAAAALLLSQVYPYHFPRLVTGAGVSPATRIISVSVCVGSLSGGFGNGESRAQIEAVLAKSRDLYQLSGDCGDAYRR